MSDTNQSIIELPAAELAQRLADGETTSVQAVQAHLERIEATDGTPLDPQDRAAGKSGLNAFLHVDAEHALEVAEQVDRDRAEGRALPVLAGVPIAVKDLIVTRGQPTTAASRMPSEQSVAPSSKASCICFSPARLVITTTGSCAVAGRARTSSSSS